MKKYIFFTILFVLCSFLFCGCTKKEDLDDLSLIKERGYLIVGVKVDSPPFGFYKDGSIDGFDIEIAQNIAQNIFHEDCPANIEYVPVNAQNRISKLNSKEVDILVATMSINEKRKLVIDFSKPYFETSQKIMVPKTSLIKSLRYFNKSGKIVVVMGTTGEKIIHLIAPNAHVVGAKTYIEAFSYLKNRQADAILGDDAILQGFNDGNYTIVNRAYSKEFYGVALRKGEKSKKLLNVVNASISQIMDDKRINLIKDRWITKTRI